MSRKSPRSPEIGAVGDGGAMGVPRTLSQLGRAGDVGTRAHYVDPAYYAKTYRGRTEDVAFYTELARRSKGPVLEYGIGAGRIAVPMAQAGVDVMGVDLSKPMLEALRQRLEALPPEVAARIEYRSGDMRQVRLARRFPLVIATFNTFLHLYERRDVERFLARVRSHLTPGGRFVFDVSLPRPEDLVFDPDRAYGAPPIKHPTLGQRTRYAERFGYDPIRQILLIQMEFRPDDGEPYSVPLTHRQFFPREIEALLHYNGFSKIELTQNFTSQPAGDETDTLVVTCAPKRR